MTKLSPTRWRERLRQARTAGERGAFSPMEILVGVFMIAVLARTALLGVNAVRQSAEDTVLRSNLTTAVQQVQTVGVSENGFSGTGRATTDMWELSKNLAERLNRQSDREVEFFGLHEWDRNAGEDKAWVLVPPATDDASTPNQVLWFCDVPTDGTALTAAAHRPSGINESIDVYSSGYSKPSTSPDIIDLAATGFTSKDCNLAATNSSTATSGTGDIAYIGLWNETLQVCAKIVYSSTEAKFGGVSYQQASTDTDLVAATSGSDTQQRAFQYDTSTLASGAQDDATIGFYTDESTSTTNEVAEWIDYVIADCGAATLVALLADGTLGATGHHIRLNTPPDALVYEGSCSSSTLGGGTGGIPVVNTSTTVAPALVGTGDGGLVDWCS